jgi:hypothetical protein
MATSFITNADYLDDRRYVCANRYPVQGAQSVILCDESIIRAFDEVGRRRPFDCKKLDAQSNLFWQNEAKIINTFKGDRLAVL